MNNTFLLFTDKNSVVGSILTINSILEIYNSKEIYIGADSESVKILKKYYFNTSTVIIKDITIYKNKIVKHFISIKESITWPSMLRLFTFEIFPRLINKKFIYVDTDVYFINKFKIKYLTSNKNIGFLSYNGKSRKKRSRLHWNKILSPEYKRYIEKKFRKNKYFNSGVLIINDPIKFNEDLLICMNIFLSCKNSKWVNDDQTLLNIYAKSIYTIKDFSQNNNIFELPVKNMSVIHFTGEKPWNHLYDKNYLIDFDWIYYLKREKIFAKISKIASIINTY